MSGYGNIKVEPEQRPPSVRRTIKRNNKLLEAAILPVIMNINPRSIYNKSDEFPILVEQYDADIICISESWERENLKLEELLELENYRIITNVKQQEFKGGNQLY